jgi:hypothetical protein
MPFGTCRAAGPAQPNGYRLAGTLAVGKDYLALIAVPEGGQVLARAGSVIGGVKVVAVTVSTVRLEFPSGVVELTLQGSGAPREVPGVASAGAVKAASQHGQIYERDVAVDELSRELRAPSMAGGQNGGNKASMKLQSAQHLAEVLDLPPGSQVLKVGAVSVASAEQVIKELDNAFAHPSAMGLTLEVQTPKGPARVYIRRAK